MSFMLFIIHCYSLLISNEQALFLKAGYYVVSMWLCGSLSKIIDMPVNGSPSLFNIDSVHEMETKSMVFLQ
jgi:hypothetical protein